MRFCGPFYSHRWGIHLDKSGTATDPIVLKSEAHGKAVIDGRNDPDRNQGFYVSGASMLSLAVTPTSIRFKT